MNATVSVIIPVYNQKGTLKRAIQSALSQTRSPFEIIVVDDCSTDGSPALVRTIKDPRLRLIEQRLNLGAAAARNRGIAEAQGEWIAFLDADDEWSQNKLELQLPTVSPASGGSRASVTGYLIDDFRTNTRRMFKPLPGNVTLDSLVWGCALSPGATLLVAREIFQDVGVFDTELKRLEDWDWLIRYTRRYSLAFVAAQLAIVHKTGNPSYTDVSIATAVLRRKHAEYWQSISYSRARRFRSSLQLECAAAAFFSKSYVKAIYHLLTAIALYPLRNTLFYSMILRNLIALLKR